MHSKLRADPTDAHFTSVTSRHFHFTWVLPPPVHSKLRADSSDVESVVESEINEILSALDAEGIVRPQHPPSGTSRLAWGGGGGEPSTSTSSVSSAVAAAPSSALPAPSALPSPSESVQFKSSPSESLHHLESAPAEIESLESRVESASGASGAEGCPEPSSAEAGAAGLSDLWAVRRQIFLGAGLLTLQQLIGINTVMYYSVSILQQAGVGSVSTVIWLAVPVAASQLVGCLLGGALIDRCGRRPLVLISLTGAALSLGIEGGAFAIDEWLCVPDAHTAHACTCTLLCACIQCTDGSVQLCVAQVRG